MRIIAAAVLFNILLSVAASPVANSAAYIKFDGVDGESTHRGHEGWSDLSHFQVDISRSADGGTLGRETISTKFGMVADKSYPYLANALLQAQSFDSITVELWNGNQLTTKYEYEHALTPDLSVAYSGGAPGRLNGTLISQSLILSHYVYDPSTGSLTDTIEFEYDFSPTAGSVVAPGLTVLGDYNSDGGVDQLDYQLWKSDFGVVSVPIGSGADGNGDGLVNLADYTIWRNNVGRGNPSAAFAASLVPEPTSLAFAALGLVGLSFAIGRR